MNLQNINANNEKNPFNLKIADNAKFCFADKKCENGTYLLDQSLVHS